MDRSSPVSRKLAEAFFRRFWLLLLPVVAVPAIVIAFKDDPVVYESGGSAWVSETATSGSAFATGGSRTSTQTVAERQVEVLNDLVATRAFREAVAVAAGLTNAGAPETERSAAADALRPRLSAVAMGPNLVALMATASSAAEAQAVSLAFIGQYQERARTEAAREAATILAYFDQQATQAQADVQTTRDAAAAYLAANPKVATTADAEYQRLLSLITLQESVLQRVLQSQNDARLSAASLTASADAVFVVQDVPTVPEAPVATPLASKLAYPAAGVVVGMLIAAAMLWLAYRTDRTIRSAEDLEDMDVEVLGSVPELAPEDVARRFTPLRWAGFLRRNYARRVAASISPLADEGRAAS